MYLFILTNEGQTKIISEAYGTYINECSLVLGEVTTPDIVQTADDIEYVDSRRDYRGCQYGVCIGSVHAISDKDRHFAQFSDKASCYYTSVNGKKYSGFGESDSDAIMDMLGKIRDDILAAKLEARKLRDAS